jgi:Tol biopolymer transport system component
LYRPATLAAALLLLILPAGAYADGQLAYEGQASSSGALLLRAPGGKQVKRLSAPGTPVDPAFSPTGRRLAFTSRNEIWVMYEDGTNVRQVTLGTQPNRDPTWSPAGDELAFTTGSRGRRDLLAVSADGRVLRPLTSGSGDDQSPAWSSDDVVAFVRSGDVYAMRGRGGGLRRLTRGAAEDRSPAWSADGRRIAFTRLAAKRPARKKGRRRAPKPVRELWVMRSGGGFERRVKQLPGPVAAPAWSPDGRRIAFVMTVKGRRGLYTIRADGRGVRRVTASARGARSLDWQPSDADPFVAAAGDIACDPVSDRFDVGLGTSGACHMVQTSDVLMRMDLSAIAVLGDVQYEDGTYDKFVRSFDPTWGRLKNLMHPTVGNHEYRVPGAAGYFDYFNGAGVVDGPAGPRDKGYYSYDLGRWHVVVLNSQCSERGPNPNNADCAVGSPQEQWLRADLAANPSRCTLAYWHHPLLSTGVPGFNSAVQPLFQALVDGGVDVLLTGHDHGYERFAPMDATATRDTARGVRQFVVGTGGKNLEDRSFPAPNSEIRENSTYGVLKLTLRPSGYLWGFVPETGATFTDTGANACH